MSHNRKITKYRKPLNINIGMVIFGGIFVYIIIILFLYMHTSHLTGYEVKTGSLAVNSTFTGVAIRSESIISANNAGYINYYAREDEHVSSGGLVYSIDESGKLSEMIAQNTQANGALTDSDLNELRDEIINYRSEYSDSQFSDVYTFKDSVDSMVRKLVNQNALKNLAGLSANTAGDVVSMGYSPDSGVVVYNTDGLENLKPGDVTQDTLDETKHPMKQFIDDELVGNSDSAYKLVTSENWSIVVRLDDTAKQSLSGNDYVKVKFLKNNEESWAAVKLLTNADGDYCELDFTNSMITFASDRYVDIELELDEKSGLKIPNSAIVEREFYMIPADYKTNASPSDSAGFLRQTYNDSGTMTTEFVQADTYAIKDGYRYVDTNTFNSGDVLVKPDSQDTFTVSQKGKIKGVYDIDKGYAYFRNVNILYSNKEYSIVDQDADYGLVVYDHIVLDGDGVYSDDFVYDTDLKK